MKFGQLSEIPEYNATLREKFGFRGYVVFLRFRADFHEHWLDNARFQRNSWRFRRDVEQNCSKPRRGANFEQAFFFFSNLGRRRFCDRVVSVAQVPREILGFVEAKRLFSIDWFATEIHQNPEGFPRFF